MIKPVCHFRGSQLYRGNRPGVFDIEHNRIESIVSLQSGIYQLFHQDEYEELDFVENGLRLFDRGLSDFLRPSEEDVIRIVKLIVNELRAGHNVLVHCLAGKDRTGIVIAAFRILVNGWSYEDAKREMYKEGMHWHYRILRWPVLLKQFEGKRLEDYK